MKTACEENLLVPSGISHVAWEGVSFVLQPSYLFHEPRLSGLTKTMKHHRNWPLRAVLAARINALRSWTTVSLNLLLLLFTQEHAMNGGGAADAGAAGAAVGGAGGAGAGVGPWAGMAGGARARQVPWIDNRMEMERMQRRRQPVRVCFA